MFVTSVGLVFMFRDSAFLQILKQVSNWPLCLLLHKYIWYLYSLSSPQFDVPCHISCTLNKGIIAGEESVSSHLQSSHWCLHLRQVLSSRFVWISGHRWCQTCHNRTDCKWENTFSKTLLEVTDYKKYLKEASSELSLGSSLLLRETRLRYSLKESE